MTILTHSSSFINTLRQWPKNLIRYKTRWKSAKWIVKLKKIIVLSFIFKFYRPFGQ
jgi:hypothetical protein